MDISAVLQAVTHCVQAQNQDGLTLGQKLLAEQAVIEGYPLRLMMIADAAELDVNLRLFAVTDLKNSITKHWRVKKDPVPQQFREVDKTTVKNSLLDALIRSADSPKLCKMYCKIILDVCAYDFPDQWPNLVEQALAKLSVSESPNEIYGCCLALQQVFSNLQFEMERKVLDKIIPVVFPAYQNLIAKLMGVYNLNNAYLLKPILRSFYMCINVDLPEFLKSFDVLAQWINFIKLLIDSEIPAELRTPTTDEEIITQRDSHSLWKNKKWASRILYKFVMRYANKKIVTGQSMQALVQWLVDTHMIPVMQSFVQQLVLSQTSFVGNATQHFGIKFLIKVFKFQNLFDAFVPHIETILYDTVFPMLALTQRDSELWESDPAEFIRQEDDFSGSTRNNKNIAMDLLAEIAVNTFSQNKYLHQFVQFCVTFIETNANPRNGAPITLAIKDGIFFALGKLKEQIMSDVTMKDQIEILLEKYILPEFSNANPFIRSRTCWVFGRYGFIEFRNPKNIQTAVEGITKCMSDTNLPVKFKAALALHSLVKQKPAYEMVRGHLSTLLAIYLKLMEEIDSEELVASLEGIVSEFSADIGPYAYDLCVHLSSAFYKYRSKDSEIDNDDDGECQLAAGGCLDAIGKIISSPLTQEVLTKLEEVILPILNHCLVDDQCDYMEEAMYLLQQISSKKTTISSDSGLWFYYPILIYIVSGREGSDLSVGAHLNDEQKLVLESAVNGWGIEHLSDIVIVLKNFIQKGGEFFLRGRDLFGTNFAELLLNFVQIIYKKSTEGLLEDDEEGCMKNSLTVFYALIENHIVDQAISGPIIASIIQITLGNLNTPKAKTDILVANLETICLCFFYNSQETFGVLVKSFGQQILPVIFQRWLQLVKQFKTDFSLQRLLLGFTAILACPTLPQEVQQFAQKIVSACVSITSEIITLREEEDFEDDEEEEEDDESESKSNLNEDGLQAHIQKISDFKKGKQSGGNDMDGDDGDEDDDDDIDSDFDPLNRYSYSYCYDCPLDEHDEILLLEQKLVEIAQGNPALYVALTSHLSEAEKATFQANFEKSRLRYKEYLEAKQEEEQKKQK